MKTQIEIKNIQSAVVGLRSKVIGKLNGAKTDKKSYWEGEQNALNRVLSYLADFRDETLLE